MSKVSVLIPTHNRKDLLKLAIDSVLCQTFSDFELIIIDDRSTDGTEELVKTYTDERILYLKNTENPMRTHWNQRKKTHKICCKTTLTDLVKQPARTSGSPPCTVTK